jgi:uncharacterized protein (DUF1501 family)
MMVGGCDSYNMLVPMSGCEVTKSDYYRERGSHAMNQDDLLPISAENQVCTGFGVHNQLEVIQTMYNEGEALFAANTGILTKPMNKFDKWSRDSRIQLFAHNSMQNENYKVDPLKEKSGSGVAGRILDMLRKQGYQTSANGVDTKSIFVKGDSYYNNPTWTVSSGTPSQVDKYSSLGPGQMLNLIRKMNGVGESDNSVYGETWSVTLAQSLFELDEQMKLYEAMKSGEFNMDGYPGTSGLNSDFKSVAQYIKSRHLRNVDREAFFIKHGSYDMHGASFLNDMFAEVNSAIVNFKKEMIGQSLWDNIVLIMGSDFGRTMRPNSHDGTDHGWGGNYFIAGGSVKGGQIIGTFPERLGEEGDYWTSRGRMIPTTPWDSIWNGVANWMGVKGDDELDFILPNRGNFPPCDMFSDQELFTNGLISPDSCFARDSDGDGVPDSVDPCPDTPYWADVGVDANGCLNPTAEPTDMPTAPTAGPTAVPTASPTRKLASYEAEADNNIMSENMNIKSSNPGYSGTGYVDFGGMGTWLEFTSVDGGTGGECQLEFKYAAGSEINRACDVSINGQPVGTAIFPKTEDWSDWQHEVIQATCQPGANAIRLTVSSNRGGPNLDNLVVIPACASHGGTCETSEECCSGVCRGDGTCSALTAVPTKAPTTPDPTVPPSSEPTPAPEPTKSPTAKPTSLPLTSSHYQIEDATDMWGITIKNTQEGYTGWGYADMGGKGTWFELGDIATEAGLCSFDFRYALGGDSAKAPRPCIVSIDGVDAGTLNFPLTGGWSTWGHEILHTTCPQGPVAVRVTASTDNGGPNFDNVLILTSTLAPVPSPTSAPVPDPTSAPLPDPTSAPLPDPTSAPVPAPTPAPSPATTEAPVPAPTGAPVPPPSPSNTGPIGTAVATVLDPDSTGTRVGITNTPDITRAYDGTTSKLLLKANSDSQPGFDVTPVWPQTIVRGIRVYTSRDKTRRDPTSFILSGWTDANGEWQGIAEGGLSLPSDRNSHNPLGHITLSTPTQGDPNFYHEEILFENTQSYSKYRVIFPGAERCVSQVELPGLTI